MLNLKRQQADREQGFIMVVTAMVISSSSWVSKSTTWFLCKISKSKETPNELIIATTSDQALIRHQNHRSR